MRSLAFLARALNIIQPFGTQQSCAAVVFPHPRIPRVTLSFRSLDLVPQRAAVSFRSSAAIPNLKRKAVCFRLHDMDEAPTQHGLKQSQETALPVLCIRQRQSQQPRCIEVMHRQHLPLQQPDASSPHLSLPSCLEALQHPSPQGPKSHEPSWHKVQPTSVQSPLSNGG